MSASISRSEHPPGFFCPHGLIITGLVFMFGPAFIFGAIFGVAFMFWHLPLAITLAVVTFHPIIGTICVLSAVPVFVWLTRLAWRRNTWLSSSFHLLGFIITQLLMFYFLWPMPS